VSLRDDKRGHVKIENGMAVIYVPADETHGISRQAPYPARVVRLPGFCGHPCPGARPAHCAGLVRRCSEVPGLAPSICVNAVSRIEAVPPLEGVDRQQQAMRHGDGRLVMDRRGHRRAGQCGKGKRGGNGAGHASPPFNSAARS
jgi:hypothetical protein